VIKALAVEPGLLPVAQAALTAAKCTAEDAQASAN
jgi:hypothetical protein